MGEQGEATRGENAIGGRARGGEEAEGVYPQIGNVCNTQVVLRLRVEIAGVEHTKVAHLNVKHDST